jgi:hypothetical protein
VFRENDVPGRSPGLGQRAGLSEDFVLAEVPSSPIASARPPSPGEAPGTTPAPVGTAGSSGAIYKLQLVDKDKLKALLGRRVEVVGRVEGGAAGEHHPAPAAGQPSTPADRVLGREPVILPELAVTSIREVAGTCPPTPDPRP